MLEPQSTLFFVLLMVVFSSLLVWLVLTRQIVFRVLAACLAFIPAMVFGIAAVNKYYDYYQTWGAMLTDLSGQSAAIPHLTAASLGSKTGGSLRNDIMSQSNPVLDRQLGWIFNTSVTGPRSHISREVYVYLPPQYFWKSYADYRFPAIELLHGSPGKPTAWLTVMDLIPIYQSLLAAHKAQPAVLVMPDTDGGWSYSLQCLNDPHGLQDMTWVGQEVPGWVAANVRVQPPGPAWGIAGYSEGGFCSANIALQYSSRFSYAGVMSGYFKPSSSQVPLGGKPNGRPIVVNDFAHDPRLAMINTPEEYILHYPFGKTLPRFFFAAGAEDRLDISNARYFRQELMMRTPDVPPIDIIPGGGHVALVWRTALTPLLEWMTNGLAHQVRTYTRVQQVQAAHNRTAPHPTRARTRLLPANDAKLRGMSVASPRFRPVLGTFPPYRPGRVPAAVAGRAHKLSSNESPYGPLPSVAEAIAAAGLGVNRYPDNGAEALTDALARRFCVPPDHIAVGCGSVGVLKQVIEAVSDPGAEVLYAWRSFEAYPPLADLAGATSVRVPLREQAHDLEAMAAAITPRTRLVLVCNPNNPTGTVVTGRELTAFLDRVPADCLVVLDEAYREYVRDAAVPDGVDLYRDRPNVAVLRTFSKAYGLAGLRVGFLIGHPPVAEAARTTMVPFAVNAVAQAAAIASLAAEEELLERVDAVVKERDRVRQALLADGWAVPQTEANFVWLPLRGHTTAFAGACDSAGISVRPFAGEGARVSIGTPEANDAFLAATRAFRRRGAL